MAQGLGSIGKAMAKVSAHIWAQKVLLRASNPFAELKFRIFVLKVELLLSLIAVFRVSLPPSLSEELFQRTSKKKANMELGSSESSFPGSGNWQIPIDLFGSKKHAGVPRGVLAFADDSGNILFKVNRHPPNPNSSPLPKDNKLLLDAAGNTLFSIHRYQNGSWKCYKGENQGNKELVFRVQRTLKTFTRVELEVFFDAERSNDQACDFKVKGSPFRRSCCIYKDVDLVAQSSLMYKLHQLYASRGKFRLTIFPGTIDHALLVALFVIFLNGRK
ncbi:hypothetical protein VNO77_32022 [Canavalia gladiata]|uniref:Protein LURP-one-related 7 n=1 Tax=Canavalia gladiata TaxID=3824 RepID=A0AAN9KQ76_CANGL